MKKINKVVEKIIYTLDEEDKKAIRRIYNLLDEIHWDMSIDDTIEANEDNATYFEYGEISNLHEELEELLIVKRIIHTTSAGTQGITNASHADEIITGSLVNAKAIAAYIKQKNPEEVSLVCMGWQ